MAPLCFPFLPVCFVIIIVRHQSFMALIHILSHTVSFFEFHSGFLPLVCFHDWEQQDTSTSSSNINVDFCSVRPLLRGCVCLPWCTFICHSCPPILLLYSSHQHPRQCGFTVMIIMMIKCHQQQDQNSNVFWGLGIKLWRECVWSAKFPTSSSCLPKDGNVSFEEFLNVALEYGQISSRAESAWAARVCDEKMRMTA